MLSFTNELRVDNAVMFVLSRLRGGGEKWILVNLRRNGLALRNRSTLRSSLRRLMGVGVVSYDVETHEYTLDYDRAEAWVVSAERLLDRGGKELGVARDLLFKTSEQVKARGAWWYSYARVAVVKKGS